MTSLSEHVKKITSEIGEPMAPAANYQPLHKQGNLIFISGQLPFKEGHLEYKGKVGEEVSEEEGVLSARLCAVNILAQLEKYFGDQDVSKFTCVKLTGFVNAKSTFTNQPEVVNGASDLMIEVFGDKGQHARAAVGVDSLPRGVSVEVEAIFSLD